MTDLFDSRPVWLLFRLLINSRAFEQALDILKELQKKLPIKSSYVASTTASLDHFIEEEKKAIRMSKPSNQSLFASHLIFHS